MADEAKFHSPAHSTFEALIVQHVVSRYLEKNWAHPVDQCQVQELPILVHFIDLLSILLRYNGFLGIQKAVVD